MPHQCTNCARTFSDGSKQMLAGCPDCGGNKFQFLPEGAVGTTAGESETTTDEDIIEAPPERVTEPTPLEDSAQASARRSVATADDLPPADTVPTAEPPASAGEEPEVPEEPDSPDLAQLREELNEQFESIKILQPGEYELNLMELYDRQEYIIALEEDGRYAIDVPDSWPER